MCAKCDRLAEMPQVKAATDYDIEQARGLYQRALNEAEEAYQKTIEAARVTYDTSRIEAGKRANEAFVAAGKEPPFDADWLRPVSREEHEADLATVREVTSLQSFIQSLGLPVLPSDDGGEEGGPVTH